MATTTETPVNFIEGRDYPSPVTHVVGFDYYDGVTSGILKTSDGSAYRFEMTSEEFNPDGLNDRTYQLTPIPIEVFDSVVALISQHISPAWPVWVPIWKFPSAEIQGNIDREIDRLVATDSEPTWRVTACDITDSISATRA